jgi:TM2 domain-containing membrane protein YozV
MAIRVDWYRYQGKWNGYALASSVPVVPGTSAQPLEGTIMSQPNPEQPGPGQYPVQPPAGSYQDPYQAPQAPQPYPAYPQTSPQFGGYLPEQKSKIAAGLLGIFLGGLGIHRFYLGHTKIGVIQLVLTLVLGMWTFGLVGLWGFIEGIMILCGAQAFKADARGVPLKD